MPPWVCWIAFQFMAPSIIIWVVITCAFRLGKELFLVIPLCIRALPQIRIRLNLITSGKQIRDMINFGGLSFVGGLGYLLYYSTDSIIISNLDALGVESVFLQHCATVGSPGSHHHCRLRGHLDADDDLACGC